MTRDGRGLRYRHMFERLRGRGEGAFVPFVVLGDPDPAASLSTIKLLIEAGADALELGLPFSDPVADGPVVQAAAVRALAAGMTLRDCWEIVGTVRRDNPEIPIGILAYANLALSRGPERFYGEAAAAGADSVLIPDLPIFEAGPAARSAREAGIAPVFIVPPNVDEKRLRLIAQASEGYTYVTARAGVTGGETRLRTETTLLLERLGAAGAPPPLLGFGISRPDQVRAALQAGAAGAIVGSAIIRRVSELQRDPASPETSLAAYLRSLKDATRS